MTGTEPEEARDRTLRARNRALLVVFAALAVLLYAVTLVRIAGY